MKKIKPCLVIADLEEYIKLYDVYLSNEAKKTLMETENFAYMCNNAITFNLIFSKVIRNTDIIQTILKNKGGNPKLIAVLLEKHYYDTIDNLGSYENDDPWYSEIGNRKICEKIVVIDRALEYCSKDNRTLLDNTDIFLAAMDEYERCLNEDRSTWTDKELNKEYVTLSHVCGRYDENLWIKFDDIREGLKKSKENVEVA